VAGLYRNKNDRLRDIDLLRCCSMVEEQGEPLPSVSAPFYKKSFRFFFLRYLCNQGQSADRHASRLTPAHLPPGHHPDLVQELHSSAITASSCYSDFSSEGMHPVLGKE
jgi:hypothetical protein